jgi:homoserine dehydrogenase
MNPVASLIDSEPGLSSYSENVEALKVAIVGFGTVGRSVARILSERPVQGLRLTHICNRNVQRKRVDWLSESVRWTEDIDDVLSSDVDILIELIGGIEPAGGWIRRALTCGKSVVTANKQLIARHRDDLSRLARLHGQHIFFGASVAGGVPVISGLQEGLAGDELVDLCGILNGTCNYILTQIERAGISFAEALREAQRLGFAESDPTEDIDGLDARAKLAILARTALRVRSCVESIRAQTISHIEPIDFEYAKLLGCTIRQLSRARKECGELFASVEPVLVPTHSPLAQVDGARNLLVSTGRFGGETIFAGHGAGGYPTAVAVLSDVLAIARSQGCKDAGFDEVDLPELPVSPDFTSRHYLRFTVKDEPGIVASLAAIFSKLGMNIDSIFQRPGYTASKMPFVITLESCPASLVDQALKQIGPLSFHVQPCLRLPILN